MTTEVEYLTGKEVCGILKTHKSTVYRLINEGELPALRIAPKSIRIRRDGLEKFLEERRIEEY